MYHKIISVLVEVMYALLAVSQWLCYTAGTPPAGQHITHSLFFVWILYGRWFRALVSFFTDSGFDVAW